MSYRTPGVFVREIPSLPPSVASLSTAIPAFIGYTEFAGNLADATDRPLAKIPRKIKSIGDYERHFGKACLQKMDVVVDADENPVKVTFVDDQKATGGAMYHQLQMYFLNGGGPCYIISVGGPGEEIKKEALDNTNKDKEQGGLYIANMIDEITLLVFPDALQLPNDTGYSLFSEALSSCEDLMDRFAIIDVKTSEIDKDIETFRTEIGANALSYGAAYYPYLETSLTYYYPNIESLKNNIGTIKTIQGKDLPDLPALKGNSIFLSRVEQLVRNLTITLPPSGAMAGIYAQVDRSRGVFKAPANVSLNGIIKPQLKISRQDQEDLNVSSTGKSVNAIRSITGSGTIVRGARTLEGNSNDWRYINVRRFFIFIEESIKKAVEHFVFEPNNENTWVRIRGMIENFLIDQWKSEALTGKTPNQAFFVRIGLGETMSEVDIQEGKLIVKIGLAAVRPAEFIILEFTHKLQGD